LPNLIFNYFGLLDHLLKTGLKDTLYFPFKLYGNQLSLSIEKLNYVHFFQFNPNYALEAKRANALVGFNPDLATLGFHQQVSYDSMKTLVLLSRCEAGLCEAEKMQMHFLGLLFLGFTLAISYGLMGTNNIKLFMRCYDIEPIRWFCRSSMASKQTFSSHGRKDVPVWADISIG